MRAGDLPCVIGSRGCRCGVTASADRWRRRPSALVVDCSRLRRRQVLNIRVRAQAVRSFSIGQLFQRRPLRTRGSLCRHLSGSAISISSCVSVFTTPDIHSVSPGSQPGGSHLRIYATRGPDYACDSCGQHPHERHPQTSRCDTPCEPQRKSAVAQFSVRILKASSDSFKSCARRQSWRTP